MHLPIGAADLPDMTWEEAAAAFTGGAVALLPVGATEAHGPHLPLFTDVYLSLELCARVRLALAGQPPAVVLPPLTLAVTRYAAGFAGTLSLRPETASAVLSDVLDSLARHGVGTVALVNSHLEPAHLAGLVAATERATPQVLLADHCRKPWALELSDEFKTGDCHAGSYETSLLLASRFCDTVRREQLGGLAPQRLGLVKAMRAGVETFEAMGAGAAYFGDPAAASAAEGEALWDVLTRMWVEAIVGAAADPPGPA